MELKVQGNFTNVAWKELDEESFRAFLRDVLNVVIGRFAVGLAKPFISR